TVKDAAAPRGRLVFGWRAASEKGQGDLRRLMDTFAPGETVDFARTPTVRYAIEAPIDAAPFVVLDVDHTFWPTMAGRGRGYVGSGKSGGGGIELAARTQRD